MIPAGRVGVQREKSRAKWQRPKDERSPGCACSSPFPSLHLLVQPTDIFNMASRFASQSALACALLRYKQLTSWNLQNALPTMPCRSGTQHLRRTGTPRRRSLSSPLLASQLAVAAGISLVWLVDPMVSDLSLTAQQNEAELRFHSCLEQARQPGAVEQRPAW